MKDYYVILGLDLDASPQSIKVAYRRLARELHPDRAGHLSPEDLAKASAAMAEVNEAYAVLGNVQRRHDYDAELRRFQAGLVQEVQPVPEVTPEVPIPTVVTPRVRARPQAGMISTVVQEFSNHLCNQLLSQKQFFSWRTKTLEGFNWALEAGSWTARYLAALRGFATADREAVLKFTNYSKLAIAQHSAFLRGNFFLFLLAFQRANEPDFLSAECRRFSGTDGRGTLGNAHTMIVLLDVSHGRSLPCGPRFKDKRFSALLGGMGFLRG